MRNGPGKEVSREVLLEGKVTECKLVGDPQGNRANVWSTGTFKGARGSMKRRQTSSLLPVHTPWGKELHLPLQLTILRKLSI